jgi:uncharacterized protein with von Willebrand factor type A (vWA) domain
MQLASMITSKGFRSTERVRTEYRVGLDEMDVEETIENQMTYGELSYQSLVMLDKRQKKRAVSLILDISNSMQMYKILIAVLAVGVLAIRLRGEHYSVLAFNSEVEVIKEMESEIPLEVMLERMLRLRPQGSTDIKKGLDEGLRQLSKNMSLEKIGIIATDGWATAGDPPAPVAAKYSRLHVIQVPIGMGGGDDETCKGMADSGRGRRICIDDFEDLPRAIMEILG